MSENTFKTFIFDVVDNRGYFRKEEAISETESHAIDSLVANGRITQQDTVLHVVEIE